MNITVATPLDDDRVVERRRCTHAGVSGLVIELAADAESVLGLGRANQRGAVWKRGAGAHANALDR